ncbi:MAG: heparinase, partial [bacterium]
MLVSNNSCSPDDTPIDPEPSFPEKPQGLLEEHPRIMLLPDEEALIWQAIQSTPQWRKMHDAIIAASNSIINRPVLERTMVGRRLLGTSREALRRIFYLSYSYRMTGNDKYFERAEKEMLAVARFGDWNPSHFLDVGEMTMALAIGYDWLFNKLPGDSKRVIRDAILEKGLEPSFDQNYNWFLDATHNWNQVCNAGMTFGALAIYESYPDIAGEVIDRAFNTITLAKKVYMPDGAYPEGYGYWNYGTSFNVMFLSAVDRIWPDRFDYSQHSAFLKTGSFLKNMLAPSGICYNWGDNGAGGNISPAMFWFAEKNNQSSLLWQEKLFLESDNYSRFTGNRLLPAILLWGKEIVIGEITRPDKNMYVAQGPMPLSIMRTSWSDTEAI